jgi:hypothetical protein
MKFSDLCEGTGKLLTSLAKEARDKGDLDVGRVSLDPKCMHVTIRAMADTISAISDACIE